MIRSNPQLLHFTVRNVIPGAPERTTFTHYYVRELGITADFPCCTRYTDLTRPRPRPVHVAQARFGLRAACPVHS